MIFAFRWGDDSAGASPSRIKHALRHYHDRYSPLRFRPFRSDNHERFNAMERDGAT